ncbi:hypothetical protein EXU57_08695 [Segetibacter sp. 3557_3]|uniref:hypothetical protein n=1 Tax=Segetibacter sp. 3557_3 TaxID=2547429 RepID=UPI001058CDD5|nr:hypothetical protein [Segetibacter sp. 3557_3]TDH26875.1 hypothetical protein EXU57_08695 [Segetibacter sp. 3557_3]
MGDYLNLPLSIQVTWLFLLSIPIACIAWTVTHEEVFREPREYCQQKSQQCKTLLQRKFFYLFTCEYCFSHYVTIFILVITRYQLLFSGWRGYLLAGFSLVWIANIYMSIFGRIRIVLKNDKLEAKIKEEELKKGEEANTGS